MILLLAFMDPSELGALDSAEILVIWGRNCSDHALHRLYELLTTMPALVDNELRHSILSRGLIHISREWNGEADH